MKKQYTVFLMFIFSWCVLASVNVLHAQGMTEVPHTDGMLYYKIGGGRHITIPPSMTITTINLSASASLTGLNCGRFDLGASVEASLNQVRDGVDNALTAVENAAGAAIANLPGYLLQRANPGLYDLFQNALLRAQESFSLATKSCERMQYEISNNINPYAEWITLSRGDSWSRSIGIGETNIHEAAEEAEDGHNEGITWLGGISRGGEDQEPIRVISEVAGAGMNILSDRAPEVRDDLPDDAPLRQHFDGPDDVAQWVYAVLGDLEITVCDACEKGTIPGRGLLPHIEQQTDEISDDLIAIVTDATRPTVANLRNVSAPGVFVTNQVIEAIRNQPAAQRGVIISKLAQEVAEARTMEEAMIVRRFLLTGKKDGDVSAVAMAVEEVDKALAELDSEIENVIFEKRIRSSLVANTVVEVLKHDYAQRQSALATPPKGPTDNQPLERGAVNR